MGGRGRAYGSNYHLWEIDTAARGYAVLTHEDVSPGTMYPFFDFLKELRWNAEGEPLPHYLVGQRRPRWTIVTIDHRSPAIDLHPVHTFGMEEPTLPLGQR